MLSQLQKVVVVQPAGVAGHPLAGEVEMRISHHLLVAPGTTADRVTRICAHQQALAQCRNWLDRL